MTSIMLDLALYTMLCASTRSSQCFAAGHIAAGLRRRALLVFVLPGGAAR